MNNPSRKYIDLIFEATGKLASWDPSSDIMVGDYGKLDEKTGEFNKDGNIYNDTHIFQNQKIAQLIKDHSPILCPGDDVFVATSSNVKRGDFNLGAEVSAIPGLAESSIKGQWIFGSRPGALLIAAYPRCSYIPFKAILKLLVEIEALKDMFLVTEVLSCPAYSLYLSSGTNEIVSMALLGSSPVTYAPVGVQMVPKWCTQNTNGLFRSACNPHGKYDYTPLYILKAIGKKK